MCHVWNKTGCMENLPSSSWLNVFIIAQPFVASNLDEEASKHGPRDHNLGGVWGFQGCPGCFSPGRDVDMLVEVGWKGSRCVLCMVEQIIIAKITGYNITSPCCFVMWLLMASYNSLWGLFFFIGIRRNVVSTYTLLNLMTHCVVTKSLQRWRQKVSC